MEDLSEIRVTQADGDVTAERLVVAFDPEPGLIQTLTAAYVPGKGWLTTRRGLCIKYAADAQPLDAFGEAELEVRSGLRAMRHRLKREGVDLFGDPLEGEG